MEYREHFVFGAGGHGRVIAELMQFNDCKVDAFIDDFFVLMLLLVTLYIYVNVITSVWSVN